MEERLDDAINVLRNHCEPLAALTGAGGLDVALLSSSQVGPSLQAMSSSGGNASVNIKQERGNSGSSSEFWLRRSGERN